MTHNESVFAMAGYSVFRHAGTEVDFCFIVEDNVCRLIINVKPKPNPNKDLLLIVLPSSPAIANTFVGCISFQNVFPIIVSLIPLDASVTNSFIELSPLKSTLNL